MMGKWKVGAIVGAVLGPICSYIPILWWYGGGNIVSVVPPTPSLYSFGVYYGLFLSAMFGALIGATVGFVIDKYRRRR